MAITFLFDLISGVSLISLESHFVYGPATRKLSNATTRRWSKLWLISRPFSHLTGLLTIQTVRRKDSIVNWNHLSHMFLSLQEVDQ